MKHDGNLYQKNRGEAVKVFRSDTQHFGGRANGAHDEYGLSEENRK